MFGHCCCGGQHANGTLALLPLSINFVLEPTLCWRFSCCCGKKDQESREEGGFSGRGNKEEEEEKDEEVEEDEEDKEDKEEDEEDEKVATASDGNDKQSSGWCNWAMETFSDMGG
jgi:hypothetical protein